MDDFTLSVLASMAASLVVAYLTARITIGKRYGEATQRLFVAIMRYYFSYKALVTEKRLEKTDDGLKFKERRDHDIYLSTLKDVYQSVCAILDSPASSELLGKNLQVAALPITLRVEIYNFEQSSLISNRSCLDSMFEIMDFLLKQRPINRLRGQKIHSEVVAIQNEINDSQLIRYLGFNPNAGLGSA
ncbi:hypothetical protein [Alkalilimnicola sp. S0819]|uniref:hypothetical protein n=1 Tax=Alkalilimnicola sp. S0819 TaxID=2613922 RepID=UPI0012620EDF|nr:hypothetical protein [Alkalilimnicola sp. S0819]KAB7619429.1 hypothetical protein F3N43_13810 [Alkalilimnicola sp. S0819]MPQ17713.1 hypothetical protein [Alkalilimnicola sp. S0819]